MDDISRELPPDSTGATPVSERQKGPEELQRFELGHIGEHAEDAPQFGDRLAGMGGSFLADRFLAVNTPADTNPDGRDPDGDEPQVDEPDTGDEPVTSKELGAEHVLPEQGLLEQGLVEQGLVEQGLVEQVEQDSVAADGAPEDAEPAEASQTTADSTAETVETTEAVDTAELAEDGVAADDAVPGTVEHEVTGPDFDACVYELGDADSGETSSSDTDREPTDEDALLELSGEDEDSIDQGAAQAAVAAEAGTVELDNQDDLVDSELGEDGLPIVPELTEAADVARMVYILMMTSREGMTVFRLAQACNSTQKLVEEGLELLQSQLRGLGLPVELTRVGDTVRWMSGASAFPYLQRLRGVKKLEKLSPAALETLAVIAYRQPVMRSEIEAIRGVKAGPMLRTLLQHKLVKVAGRADVPGRPLQYGTTQQFLERFGLASLQELPSVKEWKNLG